MSDTFTIGGRTFRPADPDTLTARRDDWVQAHVIAAGVDTLPTVIAETTAGAASARAAATATARALLLRVLQSGSKAALLAGTLDEIDATGAVVVWTPERAAALAAWLDDRTDPADKRTMFNEFTTVLMGFFVGARSSSRDTPSASSATAHPTPNASPGSSAASVGAAAASPSSLSGVSAPKRRPRRPHAPTGSAAGAPSAAPSLGTIPGAPSGAATGR